MMRAARTSYTSEKSSDLLRILFQME